MKRIWRNTFRTYLLFSEITTLLLISMILFAGIVSRLPDGLKIIFQYLQAGTVNLLNVILFAVIALAMIVFVIMISQGIRKNIIILFYHRIFLDGTI